MACEVWGSIPVLNAVSRRCTGLRGVSEQVWLGWRLHRMKEQQRLSGRSRNIHFRTICHRDSRALVMCCGWMGTRADGCLHVMQSSGKSSDEITTTPGPNIGLNYPCPNSLFRNSRQRKQQPLGFLSIFSFYGAVVAMVLRSSLKREIQGINVNSFFILICKR